MSKNILGYPLEKGLCMSGPATFYAKLYLATDDRPEVLQLRIGHEGHSELNEASLDKRLAGSMVDTIRLLTVAERKRLAVITLLRLCEAREHGRDSRLEFLGNAVVTHDGTIGNLRRIEPTNAPRAIDGIGAAITYGSTERVANVVFPPMPPQHAERWRYRGIASAGTDQEHPVQVALPGAEHLISLSILEQVANSNATLEIDTV